MSKSYLTKSKFSTAWECPRKLYYLNRKEYANKLIDDAFLKALAEGGFQVGTLAQHYYPGGTLVETLDKDEALKQTRQLLQQSNITIFEAAFEFENLFIRADIVRKKGQHLELIEVKAKSFDSTAELELWDKRLLKQGKYRLLGEYEEKIVDLAFQTWVIQHAYPELRLQSFLCMADKSKLATVNGLNQKFRISRNDRRIKVVTPLDMSLAQLGEQLLSNVDLTDDVKHVINNVQFTYGPSFRELVNFLSGLAARQEPGPAAHGTSCKACEFRVLPAKIIDGQKSGFAECWQEQGVASRDIEKTFVFDVWNYRRAGEMIVQGKLFADQLTLEDVQPRTQSTKAPVAGLQAFERQWIQVKYNQNPKSPGIYFDAVNLKKELSTLKFPLHFIDFETAMAAIPFHSGRRPYEQIAFQFSHHQLERDGRLEHKTEFIFDQPGAFPNFEFVRALKRALGDQGAILRFAAHENTVLNQIRDQLLESSEPDVETLVDWIQSVTTPPHHRKGEWQAQRQFVDMCELTKRFMWLPQMAGSNSIKKVLPAILNACSPQMIARHPKWIRRCPTTNTILDPYSLLPAVFTDCDPLELAKVEEWLVGDGELADGGAAMVAWARMQFTEMSDLERTALRQALLRYCELDTLAMVLIWEWWQERSA